MYNVISNGSESTKLLLRPVMPISHLQ